MIRGRIVRPESRSTEPYRDWDCIERDAARDFAYYAANPGHPADEPRPESDDERYARYARESRERRKAGTA